jgi:TRAP-type C4-dicarboxylate transport system permease small subunit
VGPDPEALKRAARPDDAIAAPVAPASVPTGTVPQPYAEPLPERQARPRAQRLLDAIGAVERAFGIVLLGVIVTAISVQVFTRYALGQPIAWVEESATYAFIWMVFVGASVGLKSGRHIVIETFGQRLPDSLAAAARLLVWVLIGTVLVVLIVQGWKVMGVEGRSSTISLPIELPRSWFYSAPLTWSAASMLLTTLVMAAAELPRIAGRGGARAQGGANAADTPSAGRA